MKEIILNFHGLGSPPAWIDDSERPYWLPFERFREIVSATHFRRDVIYTFDDGNKSDLDLAAPELAIHGRSGRFFVLTGRLSAPGYLQPVHVRELAACGMSIGLHGRDHVDWRRLPPDKLTSETVNARAELAEVLGAPIESVSIPFGAYNRAVMAWLRSCRFQEIHTSDGGVSASGGIVRSRTSLRADMSDRAVEAIIHGRDPLLKSVRRRISTFARRNLL